MGTRVKASDPRELVHSSKRWTLPSTRCRRSPCLAIRLSVESGRRGRTATSLAVLERDGRRGQTQGDDGGARRGKSNSSARLEVEIVEEDLRSSNAPPLSAVARHSSS